MTQFCFVCPQFISQVPVVLISLIDLDRQWFKAKIGMDGYSEITRKGSLCSRLILEDSPRVMATEDVQKDKRFAPCSEAFISLPEQPAAPVRFYAAVSLIVDGCKIGTLSLYDSIPRHDLVEKAVRLLPDFGAIISDSMDLRHQRLLGAGSELAELSMSVMYNLKYPLAAMQQTVASLGECVAFQPTKRVSKVPITQSMELAADTSARTEGFEEVDRDDTSSCDGLSSTAGSPKIFCTEHLHTATCGPLCPLAQKHTKYRKQVHLDAIRAEKEKLVDLMLDLRKRTGTLIKQLDRSLFVAHSLQAEFQRHSDTSKRPTPTSSFNAAARKSHEEAAREKIVSNAKISHRLKCIYTNYVKSSLCSSELNYSVDPLLLQSPENESKRYQFNSKALMLVMFTSMYHLTKAFPASRMDVSVRFEERDLVPAHQLLANRVGSPTQAGRFNSHKLSSPSSIKSNAESGKETRLPSFSQPVTLVVLSGSSDGSAAEHMREIVLQNTSRRSSLDDYTASTVSNNTTGVLSGLSSMLAAEGKPISLPAPIHIPMFTSPRSSIRRSSNSAGMQVCGDLLITFRCALKSSENNSTSSKKLKEKTAASAEQVSSKKGQFSFESSIENHTFEKIILKNILSTVSGGFVSSSGVEYNPDAPGNPAAQSAAQAIFRAQSNDGTTTMPPSLKLFPRDVQEDVRGEDCSSESDYYTLTVRIPCNVFTASSDFAPVQHHTHPHHLSHFQSVAHSPDAAQLQAHQAQKRLGSGTPNTHLTPIQSLRNFGSSGSSILTHSASSNSSKKEFSTLDFGRSSSTIMVESNKTNHILPGVNEEQFSLSPHNSMRPKPGSVPTSPTAADVAAQLALKHKLGAEAGMNISTPVSHKARIKPAPSTSGLFGRTSMLALPGALLSQMTHSLFGFGASSAANRRRLTETIKVTPSPTHM